MFAQTMTGYLQLISTGGPLHRRGVDADVPAALVLHLAEGRAHQARRPVQVKVLRRIHRQHLQVSHSDTAHILYCWMQ